MGPDSHKNYFNIRDGSCGSHDYGTDHSRHYVVSSVAGRHVAIEHDAFSSFCGGVHNQEHGDALFRAYAGNDAAKAKE